MEEIHSNLIPTPLLTNKMYTDLGTNNIKAIGEPSSFGKSLGRFLIGCSIPIKLNFANLSLLSQRHLGVYPTSHLFQFFQIITYLYLL